MSDRPPVRIAWTLRRPRHPGSQQVQDLLAHLRAVGFTGAPEPLGFDDEDREVIGWIDGDVPADPPFDLPDDAVIAGAELILAFHDAAASSPWAAHAETVRHGDLGPHNTVFRDGRPVAIIDWDDDVAPGTRANDFAHAAWGFADLLEPAVPVVEQARRLQLMCDAYPGMTPTIVVDELAARFARARAIHDTAGRDRAVVIFDDLSSRLRDSAGVLTGLP